MVRWQCYPSYSLDEEEDNTLPDKVFQRQQQMALLGMDASTYSMVPKAARAPTSGTINPASPEDLDEVKHLLEIQANQSKEGKFDEGHQNKVCN
jgi:hypothetical protein